MPSSPAPIDEIFLAALEKSTPHQRDQFLDEACGEDAQLRGQVERLLAAYPLAEKFLARPAAVLQATDVGDDRRARPNPMVGKVVGGRYKLLEEIGEGGMGTVWIAEQTEPVRRRVAIKLIKPGMDSRQVLSRFEAERQALALMDHPNIAKVLDGGVTEFGHPFFVMEYVKGIPITEFCDQAKVTIAGRLNLFVQVCQAVQHAHQKGIIHRDLKPTNILVCLYDGQPVPKVIDFGLAKAINQPLTEHTLYTAHGLMVGTPLYMSPEQAEFNNLDIDTRSDIYSLGVILYELLTGTTPLDRARFKDAAWQEIVRLIKEEEPSKPSTKISGSAALPTIAAQRSLDPPQMRRVMRGDLDWIVMKSLEKERSRRYETANGLARDLQRYLVDEVVEARPPSASYRLRKLVRRNRGLVVAGSLIASALVCGIAGTTWGMLRASAKAEGERRAKLEADEQKNKAVAAAAAEKAANAQAQKRLAQIEKGNEIITSIFTDLDIRKVKQGADPLEAVLARRLTKAAGQLEGEAIGDPLVVAGLQDRLGVSLLSLGHPEAAIPLFLKAGQTRGTQLGADDPATLTSRSNLAAGYLADKRPEIALEILKEVVNRSEARLGANHPDTLETMNDLALCYAETRRFDLALPLYEKALKLLKAGPGSDHPSTLTCMNNLALAYGEAGKPDLAVPLFEETLKLQKAKLGIDHPDTLNTMNNLALFYQKTGKLDSAVPLFKETLKLQKAKLGIDHPETLLTMNNLAWAYQNARKLELALPLYEETLRLQKARLGSTHFETLVTMNNLAHTYEAAGKGDLALELFEENFLLRKANLGPKHPHTVGTAGDVAQAYLAQAAHLAWFSRGKEYAAICRRALEFGKSSDDPTILERIARVCCLGLSADPSRFADALKLARKAVELGKGNDVGWPWFQLALGMSEYRNGHLLEADAALTAAMKADPKDGHVKVTSAFYRSMTLFQLGKQDEARKLAAKAASRTQIFLPFPQQPKARYWHDDLLLWMAYKEAIQLLHVDSLAPEKLADNAEALADSQDLALIDLTAAAEQAWFHQDKEYADTCRRAVELGKGSNDPTTLERVAKTCLLRPGSEAGRVADALAFARKAVDLGKGHPYSHWFQLALGMAQFRSGHWAEADAALVAALKDESNPQIWLTSTFYRAMNLFQQGKRDEARKLESEAEAKMKPLPTDAGEHLDHEDIIGWLAYKEANELLKSKGSAGASSQSIGK